MSALPRPLRAACLALVLAGCRIAAPPAVPRVPPVPPPAARGPVQPTPVAAASAPVLPVPPPITREFRGAWISPVWNGEWPRPGLAAEAQRRALRGLLDQARAMGLNAVVLHVRPAADALYPAARTPWSAYLTGTLGEAPDPYWDPLAFAVTEAHRRGLELHAWFNPFRAAPPDLRTDAAVRAAAPYAAYVVRYGAQPWIDPGIPAARRMVLDDILEVVERYDIDGVHLDDYFYPYVQQQEVRRRVRTGGRTRTVTRRENVAFPDSVSWERYGRSGGFTGRAAWRRSNIDDFVATLYREVKAVRPSVAVGISPFGIWRPGSPAGITGLDAYAEIYADARRWLREGWLDYLAPQLYWPVAGAQSRFTRLDAWWRAENVQGRHLWPGLFTERETAARNTWPSGEIVRQVDTLRMMRRAGDESLGHIHFRMHALRPDAEGGIGDGLRLRLYAEPALTPPSPWLDARVPAAPRVRAIPLEAEERAVVLSVQAGDSVPVRWWAVQVLGADGGWRTLVHSPTDGPVRLPRAPLPRVVAVRAVSRTGIESAPTSLRIP